MDMNQNSSVKLFWKILTARGEVGGDYNALGHNYGLSNCLFISVSLFHYMSAFIVYFTVYPVHAF